MFIMGVSCDGSSAFLVSHQNSAVPHPLYTPCRDVILPFKAVFLSHNCLPPIAQFGSLWGFMSLYEPKDV